ncbi:MAG: aldolase/citrate lyase family protein [Bacillota bacterium]|nr:aldolase/citrate lyase family protein [Bacillota bacterium]
MDRLEQLRDKLEKCETVFGFIAQIRDTSVLPSYMKEGIDFILFDLEHGSANGEQISDQLHICRSLNIPNIVRVQDAIYHLIAKLIDMGADGIMLPRTETVEQVATAVGAIRFAPIGKKGFGGSHQFRQDETFEAFQKNRLLILQIESPAGVENLPAILRNYGDQIAGIVIGPYDMSMQVGTPMDIDSPQAIGQIRKTIKICTEHKTSVGIYCGNMETAKRWHDEGMNILWVSNDIDLLELGVNKVLKDLADMI